MQQIRGANSLCNRPEVEDLAKWLEILSPSVDPKSASTQLETMQAEIHLLGSSDPFDCFLMDVLHQLLWEAGLPRVCGRVSLCVALFLPHQLRACHLCISRAPDNCQEWEKR